MREPAQLKIKPNVIIEITFLLSRRREPTVSAKKKKKSSLKRVEVDEKMHTLLFSLNFKRAFYREI